MSSSIEPSISPLEPSFNPDGSHKESEHTESLIRKLGLQPHVEGGYFLETDRDTLRIPNPFALQSQDGDLLVSSRNASTTIYYLLTPKSPQGNFHRNKARTVHTLHKGRGRYVIIHADEVSTTSCPGGGSGEDKISEEIRWTGKARVETFIVGQNVLEGEILQWVVPSGKYKASFLLPDEEGDGDGSDGLLISETVVPGFEWGDHDFLREDRLDALVAEEQKEELRWLLRKAE